MADIINKVTSIDANTGEIYYERQTKGFNGWSDKGYKFRYRYSGLVFYPDNLPLIEPNIFKVYFQICTLMNEENLLIQLKKTNNKYKAPELIPLTIDDIIEKIPYKISSYAFKKAWQQIVPRYIKRIKFNGKKVWAVNPAFANRCRYLPPFLWNEFKEDLNEKLGVYNIKRYENMVLTEDL